MHVFFACEHLGILARVREGEFLFPLGLESQLATWRRRTMVQKNQKSRSRSSVRSFPRIAHSFACSTLLASLVPSTALTHSFTCSLTHSRACGKGNDWMAIFAVFSSVLDQSEEEEEEEEEKEEEESG